MARRTRKADKSSKPGRLRIVAGIWRSRLLDIADVPGLRPTSERIRETLFNWLQPHLEGARCLDLFAGTGALGLEALSRGAVSAVFVEASPAAVATLRRNVAALNATGADVRHCDALEFLASDDGPAFDIVFLDPPFAADNAHDLCRLLAGSSKVAAGAMVYLEEDRNRPKAELPGGWQELKTKNAGNVRYSLYRAARHKGDA